MNCNAHRNYYVTAFTTQLKLPAVFRHPSAFRLLPSAFITAFLSLLASGAIAQVNHALDFNGTSDYVALTTGSATRLVNNYTLEAWAKPRSTSKVHRILSNYRTDPRRGFGFGTIDTRWRHTSFSIKDYDTNEGSITPDAWTHIAVTLDKSNTATFYRNGTLFTTIKHNVSAHESTHPLTIGKNSSGAAEPWEGGIDEIRIWDHVRTEQQIAQHWDRTLIGTEPGLIGYYPFHEGVGSTTAEASSNTGDGILNGCTWITGPPLNPPQDKAESSRMELP